MEVKITIETGDTPESISFELSDSERSRLLAYADYVAEFQQTRFVADGAGVRLHLNYNDGQFTYNVDIPPPDDLSAFLHRLRPLILMDEQCNFQKTRSLICQKAKGTPLMPILDNLLQAFDGRQMQQFIVMSANDEIMNSERMLQQWLNGYEYHREPDKRTFLSQFHEILPLEWSRGVFVSLLVDKARAIQELNLLVKLILGSADSITLTFREK